MNSLELARKVVDCLSDGYDDEENREEAETALYNELSQLDENSVVKAALLRLCETIEELTEWYLIADRRMENISICRLNDWTEHYIIRKELITWKM